MSHKTAIERAFELAAEGLNIREIRIALARENYDPGQLPLRFGTSVINLLSG